MDRSLGALGGVRRPVGHESIRFHPFGKFIDSSRRNFETQLPKMIRLITFGPTTAGRKELIRRRGGDRRHPHLLRAPIIASNSFERSGPHATPRRRPKTTTLASSTNYNIQAARPVEAEGGAESSKKKHQQIWKFDPFDYIWCRNSHASTTRPFRNDPFDYVWHGNSRSRQTRR